jgi:myo-inositol-1(or 4)-monophosphatase
MVEAGCADTGGAPPIELRRMRAEGDRSALGADWLGLCRRSVQQLRGLFDLHPATAEREETEGIGAGGDHALVIDRRAEDAIFRELEALHAQGHSFAAISEERGAVTFGDADAGVTVVIDPIDGSLNAKRLLPTFALSIAVATGDTMEDVQFGYVYDFGTGEEYVATLGEGATLNDIPLDAEAPGRGLEVVGFESARPGWVAPVASLLADSVFRLRAFGSIAVTLCYVAATRLDGMLTMNTCRSVDAAAGQLIAREAGAFVSVLGHGGLEAPLDLDARFRIAAGRTPEGLETLVQALTRSGPPPG